MKVNQDSRLRQALAKHSVTEVLLDTNDDAGGIILRSVVEGELQVMKSKREKEKDAKEMEGKHNWKTCF